MVSEVSANVSFLHCFGIGGMRDRNSMAMKAEAVPFMTEKKQREEIWTGQDTALEYASSEIFTVSSTHDLRLPVPPETAPLSGDRAFSL